MPRTEQSAATSRTTSATEPGDIRVRPEPVADVVTTPIGGDAAPAPRSALVRALSFRNISAIYVFAAMFVVFSLWVPETFLRWDTWRALIDSQAVTAVLAVGLVVTLSAGVFDLAIGTELGFGSILVASFMVKRGMPVAAAIALTMLIGAVVGVASGILIVKARIDSFIATLGASSILIALISWVSNSQEILGLPQSFQEVGNKEIFGLTLPVYLMLIVGLVLWYLLERTPLGRRIYATGGNIEAARLSGVPVSAVIFGTLALTGLVAALAGVLESASLGSADPTIGPSYMLPAFSAAFLGSTQFRGGRFNVWGTILAVIVLATGVKGLQLAGAPIWLPDLFNGAALLIAVGMAKYEGTAHRAGAVRHLLRFDRNKSAPQLASP